MVSYWNSENRGVSPLCSGYGCIIYYNKTKYYDEDRRDAAIAYSSPIFSPSPTMAARISCDPVQLNISCRPTFTDVLDKSISFWMAGISSVNRSRYNINEMRLVIYSKSVDE